MEEIWKPVRGYEGRYEVSNFGRVMSLNYRMTKQSKLMSPSINSDGYACVNLTKDGVGNSHKVHRLVASAFIANPNNLPQVNHIDEDKLNNQVNNLEWCTGRHNVNHGTGNARRSSSQVNGSKSVGVKALDKLGNIALVFESIQEAQRNGFSAGNICECCKGRRNFHKGFMWRYLDGTEDLKWLM